MKSDVTRRRAGGMAGGMEGVIIVPPSADTTGRPAPPRGHGSPWDRQMGVQPTSHVGQHRLRVDIRKESVVALGIFPELTVGLAKPGVEFAAALGRHHSIRRSMEDEHRHRELFGLTLYPGDCRRHFG